MAKFKLFTEDSNKSPLRHLWRNFKSNHLALLGLWVFLFLTVLAMFAPLIAPYGINEQHNNSLILPPSWDDQGSVNFLLGTDGLGRDLLSRLMNGATMTFGLAIITALLTTLFGVILGILAALTKGWRSSVLNHLLDVTLAIPSLLLAIIIVAILGPGLMNTVWAIILSLLPQYIHSIRNIVSQEISKDYVIAHRLDGASKWRILLKGILPNIYEQIVLIFTMSLSTAILDIAALGFLQLGAQPPTAEWGAILAENLSLIYLAPWTVALPGFLLFITILSTNLVGDGLRQALQKRKAS
ncbi:MAG: ABC transporter permease subunit [Pseudoalteromonas spongiae]|uniref:ABC transporter permease subunit n=1 Tax=Pseudoalteromonas spongiae TaxID=298657 RepID=A0ABU8ESD1_9GAMM|nr:MULTISPECIES: ABC transporter permease subunit [Pseudoalteromonas]MEC8324907.1 ABC transporter permease subunit [Pseudomonadota bacterium]ATC99131.1 dipeptide transport system permease protein [Pseudoalteromonas spongiae UST010723-006]KPV95610.1 Peptide transport system permease protein SapC [Pseudoalteromonas sp. P1-9]MCF6458202.1 ABC transporter permease subunit [Pseudoalteromonas sp. MMG024]TMO85002.1 antimicrobial peptide ABC transporter permease SapC [Pseudoalteromonas spongiae]